MSDTVHNQFLNAWKNSLNEKTDEKKVPETAAPAAAEPTESMDMDTTSESDVLSGAPIRMTTKTPFFKKRGFVIGLSVTLLFLLFVGGAAGFVGLSVYKQATDIKAEMMEASVTGRAAYTTQDAESR